MFAFVAPVELRTSEDMLPTSEILEELSDNSFLLSGSAVEVPKMFSLDNNMLPKYNPKSHCINTFLHINSPR